MIALEALWGPNKSPIFFVPAGPAGLRWTELEKGGRVDYAQSAQILRRIGEGFEVRVVWGTSPAKSVAAMRRKSALSTRAVLPPQTPVWREGDAPRFELDHFLNDRVGGVPPVATIEAALFLKHLARLGHLSLDLLWKNVVVSPAEIGMGEINRRESVSGISPLSMEGPEVLCRVQGRGDGGNFQEKRYFPKEYPVLLWGL